MNRFDHPGGHEGRQHHDRFDRARRSEEFRARRGFGPGLGPAGAGMDPETIAQLRRGLPHGGAGLGPAFGPGRRARRSKGDVRIAILAILDDPETPRRNGYAIMKAISEATEGGWNPSPGSVYPTLQQLVDEGLVAAAGDGRSTEYSLTDEGRAFAAERAEQLANWARGEAPSGATRAVFESAGKLMAALGQFRVAATDEQKQAAAAELDKARKAIYLILAE